MTQPGPEDGEPCHFESQATLSHYSSTHPLLPTLWEVLLAVCSSEAEGTNLSPHFSQPLPPRAGAPTPAAPLGRPPTHFCLCSHQRGIKGRAPVSQPFPEDRKESLYVLGSCPTQQGHPGIGSSFPASPQGVAIPHRCSPRHRCLPLGFAFVALGRGRKIVVTAVGVVVAVTAAQVCQTLHLR